MKVFKKIPTFLMELRKHFNRPSKEEAKLIKEGCDKLSELAERKSYENLLNELERQKKYDNFCPKCGSENTVDKITRVMGSGEVSGSLYWGSGSIHGSSSIDTNEVNHCNGCGNQWKKYNRRHYNSDDIIHRWRDDLESVQRGYTYHDEIVELLKDIPAESIYKEIKRVFKDEYSTLKLELTISFLRTKFKSVYRDS